MTVHQVIFHDAPVDYPPVLIDFDGVPMAGDLVYALRDGHEVLHLVEGRFWRRVDEPVAGSVVLTAGASTAMKRHHKLYLGLRRDPRAASWGSPRPDA